VLGVSVYVTEGSERYRLVVGPDIRHTDDTPAHTETEHSMDCVRNRKIHEGAETEN